MGYDSISSSSSSSGSVSESDSGSFVVLGGSCFENFATVGKSMSDSGSVSDSSVVGVRVDLSQLVIRLNIPLGQGVFLLLEAGVICFDAGDFRFVET